MEMIKDVNRIDRVLLAAMRVVDQHQGDGDHADDEGKEWNERRGSVKFRIEDAAHTLLGNEDVCATSEGDDQAHDLVGGLAGRGNDRADYHSRAGEEVDGERGDRLEAPARVRARQRALAELST